MYDKNKVNEAIVELTVAFSGSSTRGMIFWQNLLLPNDEVSTQLNKDMIDDFRKGFSYLNEDQKKLSNKTIENLTYLRSACLENPEVKQKLEEVKQSSILLSSTNAVIARNAVSAQKGSCNSRY